MFLAKTGTVFEIQCPNNCADAKGEVIGSMIYYYESNICMAAIHSGFLLATGGTTEIKIANGEW